MRRILGIAAILTGVASASSAETSYKACAIDGLLRFFSFTEVGDFVEIKFVGSDLEPNIRPANSALLIELDDEVLVFGDDNATLIVGDEITQFDCFWMYDNEVAAFNGEASEIVAELERQVDDLRRQLSSKTYDEIEDLQGRLAEALLKIEDLQGRLTEALAAGAAWEGALLAQADKELSAEHTAESVRQINLLNAQLAEARRQNTRLRALLDNADQADAEAKVQIESLGAQLTTALEEAERIRIEAVD